MGRWMAGVLIGLWFFLAACGTTQEPASPQPPGPTRGGSTVEAEFPSPAAPVSSPLTSALPEATAVEPRFPSTPSPKACAPTPSDALGPFYKPGAPVRDRVGQGHMLRGVVRSSADCSPIPGAQIEFWLAGPDGRYGDDYRATVFAGPDGTYRFESHFPPAYSGRPPHIHIRVTAPGYQTLVTQYYPRPGQTEGTMDLVLIPVP